MLFEKVLLHHFSALKSAFSHGINTEEHAYVSEFLDIKMALNNYYICSSCFCNYSA